MSEIPRIIVLIAWLVFIATLRGAGLSSSTIYVQSADPFHPERGGFELGNAINCEDEWLGLGPRARCFGIVVRIGGR